MTHAVDVVDTAHAGLETIAAANIAANSFFIGAYSAKAICLCTDFAPAERKYQGCRNFRLLFISKLKRHQFCDKLFTLSNAGVILFGMQIYPRCPST
jgi:hypothetical protein